MVNTTPGRFTPGKDPVVSVLEAVWVPEPVWTGVENLAPTTSAALPHFIGRMSPPPPQVKIFSQMPFSTALRNLLTHSMVQSPS